MNSSVRVAVVGHVEWLELAYVARLPQAGEIVEADDPLIEPAGGGAVAAVQLARLAGRSLLLSALGEDQHATAAAARLGELGVEVHAATRRGQRTRRAFTLVEQRSASHERTIVTLGPRLQAGGADTDLPWSRLATMDAVYFTAGDEQALRAARAARVLVATPRAGEALGHGIALDALVLSGGDADEERAARRCEQSAALVVRTEGAKGGRWTAGYADGEHRTTAPADRERRTTAHADGGRWAAAPVPGAIADSYGCGDSFAAGLAYGLACGLDPPRAIGLAARCGATCLTGRGPYERMLTLAGTPS